MGGLKEMPKVGDKVIIKKKSAGGAWYDNKIGEIFTVIDGYFYGRHDVNIYVDYRPSSDTISFVEIDDIDVLNHEEPSPGVPDLLANLGRRLSVVETSLAPKDSAEVSPDESTRDTQDAVNSPSHYKRGKFETIEVIEHITAGYDDPFIAYCVGNAAKYIDRAPYKHGSPAECLRKAAWYLTRAADSVETSE